MTDKEVGGMWQWCQEESPNSGHDKLVDEMRGLIRKLVGERELLRIALGKSSLGGSRRDTLSDFGIDPKAFK